MNAFQLVRSVAALALTAGISAISSQAAAAAVCTEFASGLRQGNGVALTPHGRLLVAETGTRTPHSGRISIIEPDGRQRSLLDGLPSGIADVGDPSGPGGLLLRGRTLYLAIGVGDVAVRGPVPGSSLPNPAGPSSPLFSSVLAVHFSSAVEQASKGFTMTLADQHWLAAGNKLEMSNGGGDKITVSRVADLPNYVLSPHPVVAGNIKNANPFQLALLGDQLYATDGGRNLVWRIDLASGAAAPLVAFPAIPNPFFPVGGPMLDAVPTGLATFGDQLLVTLFRGAPFPPFTSTVQKVDPVALSDTLFIAGLKTAIDILPLSSKGATEFLVLQHASTGLFFGSPGQVLRFGSPSGAPEVVTSCLRRPISMALDEKRGRLYVTEYSGRVVAISGW